MPEIALDGELDLEGALILDSVDDEEALREAHDAGRPVVVRAADGSRRQAGARAAQRSPRPSSPSPPCSSLDLTELTYG